MPDGVTRMPPTPGAAFEQTDAERFLHGADLMADGAGGDVQLGGGAGQAAETDGRLEGTQGSQGWNAGHKVL